MARTHCAACSAEIDESKAVRWHRPDGTVLVFCSQPCRIVGEEIEPPTTWVKTGEYLGDASCGAKPTRRTCKPKAAAKPRAAAAAKRK